MEYQTIFEFSYMVCCANSAQLYCFTNFAAVSYSYTLICQFGIMYTCRLCIQCFKVGKYIQYTVAGVVGISYLYSFSVYQPRPEQWNKVVPPLTQKSESTAVFVSPWYTYRAFAYYYNIDYFKNHTRTLELLSAEHVHFLDNPQTFDSTFISQFDTIHVITCRGPMEQFDSVLTSFRYKQLHHSQYWDMKMLYMFARNQ